MLATALLRNAKKQPRTGWARASGNPIISSTQAYEPQNTVQEPSVIYESGTWKMWYTGGYSTPAVCYASCTGDPTVAANWTKYASNPVLGQGGSGVTGWASGTRVFKFGSTYYCFFYDASGGNNTKVSPSSDGLSWGTPTTILSPGTPSWAKKWAGDCFVWQEASTWKGLFSCSLNASGGPEWAVAYGESSATDPTSGWSIIGSGPLTSLAPPGCDNASGIYGGNPWLANGGGKINGRYHAWFHAGVNASVTDMFHAHSIDAQDWTITTDPYYELSHTAGTYELQQAADPCIVEVNATSYLFYSGLDNVGTHGYINVATYPSTVMDLTLWEQ